VNDTGRAYVTSAVIKGRQLIRVSIGATATQRADVEAVWAELQRAARASPEHRPGASAGGTS
jgi:aromatic-L-amino-acid decarboxylase